KYSGLWYEIARIPNPFQKKCAGNVTAFYELRKDGRLNVVNSCVEKKDTAQVTGVARVVDSKTNAKLEVSFVSLLGWNLFWGDYWIIGLGKNYEYAVVGDPNRKYGWILGREKRLSENIMEKIFSLLKEKGYDPDRFMMTLQE
ncbi:MAG TPA: lipocalin family protein, partial [bacterium]|nr:lipocalin family protein [bacterium]